MNFVAKRPEDHTEHLYDAQGLRDHKQQDAKKRMTTPAHQADTFVNTAFGSVCPSIATSKEAIKTTRVILE
jgi:hypothetical protein